MVRNDGPSDSASPGKIFIGGLHRETRLEDFVKHFEKYGEVTDSVIMKDRNTGQPRGFGFITYADPSVVDEVLKDEHIFVGKQVEIKRTIPKGASHGRDFKTKKVFVGGIPTSMSEEEFKDFFSKQGKVVDHEIIRDHETNRSRGFGFIVFENEETVDKLLSSGSMVDMGGTQVEIKKAEPKRSSNQPSAYGNSYKARSYDDSYVGYGNSYGGFGGGYGGHYGPSIGIGSRVGGYGSREFSSYGPGGGYRSEPLGGYSSRFGSYGPEFGGGYGSSLGGGYGGGMYGGFESGPASLFGRTHGGYGGRYHPYAR